MLGAVGEESFKGPCFAGVVLRSRLVVESAEACFFQAGDKGGRACVNGRPDRCCESSESLMSSKECLDKEQIIEEYR